MEDLNNKRVIKNNNVKNPSGYGPTKPYILGTVIAGILTMVPISTLFLSLINIDVNENVYIISFFLVKVIGFLIYIFALKELSIKKITIIAVAGVFLLLTGFFTISLNNSDNKGIDGIGEALATGFIMNVCLYVYYSLAFVLFILYAKKFIFKKKVIISIIISILTIILIVNAYKFFLFHSTTEKVTEEIKSVADFKNELVKRNLYDDDYFLFGVDNNDNYIHRIDFETDLNEKYPSYIYYGYKANNVNKWIIYYTNSKIYAVLGEYSESQSFQGFNEIRCKYDCEYLLYEDNEIYTYNWIKNYYEKINNEKDGIYNTDLCYYVTDPIIKGSSNRNISKIYVDVLEKTGYGYIENMTMKYVIIDEINSTMLDEYAEKIVRH